MNNRGQFSIIAALLMAIILTGTLIAVYATVRYGSSQTQTPQTLTATDQTNTALLKALGFTVGYYGSILQVTGNQTYAYDNATTYMKSALQYITSINPSLGEAINMTYLSLSNNWFSNPSISTGKLSVVYDLAALGIYGVNYTTSCSLGVQILNSPNSNQVCMNVTQDLTDPLTSLGQQNFNFYYYNYSTANWQLVNPSLAPTVSTNGTYLINVPPGIDSSAYMVQVTDSRGIMVEASSCNSYNMNFTFSPQTAPAPAIVELLQNGTMRWFGQSLLNTTLTRPIPPISISSLHLCQTGYTSDLPFQVEDWASQYQIPLSMTSNYTIFGNNQMIVFEVSPSMSQLTLWWNGSDTAIQPSEAYKDTYFTGDNPTAGTGTLTNGNVTLQFSYPGSAFQIKSTVGSVSSTAKFMRIDASASTYGSSSPNYVIHNGVIRDIVQEEAEWTNGPSNSPNVYSQIVFTLPANVTYFTYQLRLIYINSAVARNINDISPIQLTTSVSPVQAMTENGTLSGVPFVSNGTGTFTNSTGNAHHWSQLINNATLQGTGIMFTDSANQQLYAFDSMAGKFTGALYVNSATPVIELDPVTSAGPVSFTSALDLTWSGAVDTFSGVNPVCSNDGTSGLWPIVEQPPSVNINPQSSAATSITLSPSSGPSGTTVTVSGGGFLTGSQVRITFNGNPIATVTVTPYGELPLGITFTVATSTPGFYTVLATDMSSTSASAIFTLPPLETISVQTGGLSGDTGNSPIMAIDSTQYTFTTLPSSFSWPAGSNHTITVPNTVSAGNGKQYVWASWSDGGAQTHTYTVPASNTSITANYGIQWKVTFNQAGLDASTASGNVLSVNGTVVSYSSLPYNVWVNNSDRLVYSYNSSVASTTAGKQFVGGTANPLSPLVGINSAQTVTGSFTTQYYLTVTSASGSTIGSGWYNVGSTATISATPPGTGGGEQYSWNGWTGTGSGSYTGTNNPATNAVTINAVITETASWTHQYQVTVTSSPGGAIGGTFAVTYTASGTAHTNQQHNTPWTQWADASTTVTVSSPQSPYNGYTFSSYTNNPATMSSSQTVTLVYYGPINHFVFNTINTPQTAGSAFSVTITAKDAFGNTVANYGSSVGMSVSIGTINPTSTGTSGWSSGVWTGSVTLSTAGSGITITANDGSGHTGTSNAFNVNPAPIPPALDVSNSASTSGTSSYTVSLTTTKANDILYVVVSTGSSHTATISGGGLTWAQRGANVAISGSRTLQAFWASKTSIGAITITVSLSGSSSSSVVAFAVSGANTASPFDVATPSSSTGNSGTASTTISTTNADFIIGAVGIRNNPTLTKGTGFTDIGSVTSVDPETAAEYKTVTTAQTNLSVSYTLGASNNWAIIADAIKGA
jgi:hypothetical protein